MAGSLCAKSTRNGQVERLTSPNNGDNLKAAHCPPHLQFLYDDEGAIGENNSLFVSVSHMGDGHAPTGKATITASSFTDPTLWWHCQDYEALKQHYTQEAIARLSQFFHLTPETIVHQEAATPRTFAHYTGRDRGIVGGVGQRIPTFGPFSFATRTPLHHLWLVSDSTHPGESSGHKFFPYCRNHV